MQLADLISSYGLAAAALVGLCAFAVALRYRPLLLAPGARRPTLRGTLLLSLCLMASVPMISLTLVLAERAARAERNDIANRLAAAAKSIAIATDQFVDKHVTGVREIARSAEAGDTQDADSFLRLLELGNAVYDDYLTMLITDADGRVIAATRLEDGRPRRADFAGHDVSDRDYFGVPMRSGRIHVSKVFRGRGLGTDPIVAISAPYYGAGGKRAGIVEGSLDLRAFDRLRRFFPLEEFDLAIVDENLQIIFSTRVDEYPVLDALPRDGEPARLAVNTRGSLGTSQTGRTDSHLYAGAGTDVGWVVLTRQSLAPVASSVRREYAVAAGWLAATLCIVVLLVRAIMHRVTVPLNRLGQAVEAIPTASPSELVGAHRQTPREVASIFERLATLDRRLHNSYRDLRDSVAAEGRAREALALELASREAMIAERTRELTEAKDALEKVSRTDALTGLYNRAAFMESRSLTLRVCARAAQPIALIMIDVDFFKRYNDRYGHPAGDACLVKIAQVLAECARRPLDTVARYGGEEFVILLGDCTAEGASTVAEHCVAGVTALELDHQDSPFGRVTLSAGVATCHNADGVDFDTLLKLADDALYSAKRDGRHRVCVAGSPTDSVAFDLIAGDA